MTQEEVIKCLSVLKINYSTFAKGLSQKDADNLIELWMVSFADYPYEVVSRAVYDLIGTKKDFAPDIATVKEGVRELCAVATGEPTNTDLWHLLCRAASNSTYNSESEYRKLPDILKRYVGSPSALREMAMIEADVFNTVTKGTFFRTIDSTRERVEFEERVSPETLRLFSSFARPLKSQEDETKSLQEWNERRNQILDALDGGAHES